ncbi:MAG: SPOR domain-containing protein [Bacteroidaceae bacterium]|nr:SPOR domain-containing protein [Bacteroidaceae bacterium]
MEEFALCIEYILLTRSQIYVPGLGAFVVRQQAAKYDSKEEIYLPPLRVVQYVNALQQEPEDTFFTSVEQIYNISRESTEQKVNLWVTDFLQQLEDCDSLDFGCIGTFTQGSNGELLFAASESGITTPDFYALDAFHIKTLQHEQQNTVPTKEPTQPIIRATRESIVIRLNRRLLRYAAAASLLVAAMLAGTTPVDNATNQPQTLASQMFIPHHLLPTEEAKQENKLRNEQKTNAQKVIAPKVKEEAPQSDSATPQAVSTTSQEATAVPQKAAAAPQKAAAAPQTPTQVAQPVVMEDTYCIVLASAVSERNAENYVSTLQKRGFISARILKGNMNRVVIGRYKTAEEARQAATELHAKNSEYAGAWVLKTN